MNLISRENLKEEIKGLQVHITGIRSGKGLVDKYIKEYRKSILKLVDEAPAIDYKKLKPKKVINKVVVRDFSGTPIQISGTCPECGALVHTKFCGNCGAKLNYGDSQL